MATLLTHNYPYLIDATHRGGDMLRHAEMPTDANILKTWEGFITKYASKKGLHSGFDAVDVLTNEADLETLLAASTYLALELLFEPLSSPAFGDESLKCPHLSKTNIFAPDVAPHVLAHRGLNTFGQVLAVLINRGVNLQMPIREVVRHLGGSDSFTTYIRLMKTNLLFLGDLTDTLTTATHELLTLTPNGFKIVPGSALDFQINELSDEGKVQARLAQMERSIRESANVGLDHVGVAFNPLPSEVKRIILEVQEYLQQTLPYFAGNNVKSLAAHPERFWHHFRFIDPYDVSPIVNADSIEAKLTYALRANSKVYDLYRRAGFPEVEVFRQLGTNLGCIALSSIGSYVTKFQSIFSQVLPVIVQSDRYFQRIDKDYRFMTDRERADFELKKAESSE